MKKVFLTIMLAFLMFIGASGFASAAIIDFAGGTATLSDSSTVVTDNNTTYGSTNLQGGGLVDFYIEDGFKLDFVGDYGIIGNYYGPDTTGNNNSIIHAHWDPGEFGTVTSIVVSKEDGTAFDLNYFVLTSNTSNGGTSASGTEQAFITASNGTQIQLPSQDWGWSTSGPFPGTFGYTQIYLDSNWDAITSFTFTVGNDVDCFGMDMFYINEEAPPSVPEPATMLLLASGLIGLAGVRKKFRR